MSALTWVVVFQAIIGVLVGAFVRLAFHSIREQAKIWRDIRESFPEIAKAFPDISNEITQIKVLLQDGQAWMRREGARLDRLEKRTEDIETRLEINHQK